MGPASGPRFFANMDGFDADLWFACKQIWLLEDGIRWNENFSYSDSR